MAIFSSDIVTSAISASIADTAVDIFVYDTSKDSDGGAWRKRTQNTSWYNETLNTSTRGSRKEFPAVAVIVAEDNGLTIYDGDDPDLPMWMKWTSTTMLRGGTSRKLAVKNGIIALSAVGTYNGLIVIYFISDTARSYRALESNNNTEGFWQGNIAGRNDYSSNNYSNGSGGNDLPAIVAENTNDVAMTVLPNAPIDDTTGLPIPTIAVATDGGISFILDDGTVVNNYRGTSDVTSIAFDKDNSVIFAWGTTSGAPRHITRLITSVWNTPSSSSSLWPNSYFSGYNEGLGNSAANFESAASGVVTVANSGRHFGIEYATGNTNDRLGILHPRNLTNYADQNLSAFITSSYNTGYMHGDIKGAFLSDTDTTNAVGTELVTNGTFASDSDWEKSSHWTISGGSASMPSTSSYQPLYQYNLGLTAGVRYVASVDVSAISGQVKFDTAESGGGSINAIDGVLITTTGQHSFTFTASASEDGIGLAREINTTASCTIDNVSIRPEEEDRSVNNNGLAVYGTLTKSAVATGADLVAYSGFSASNYLKQPYNSDLAPGTEAYSVSCWFKTGTSSSDQYIFDRNGGGPGSRNLLLIMQSSAGNANKFQWWHRDASGNTTEIQVTDKTITDNVWHQVVALNDGATYRLYVDGEVSSITGSPIRNVVSDNNPPMFVGIRHTGGSTFITGSMALFRYSKSAPSPEQIKKMYEDEKCLFHENAKATLYGSSDAVTALAFDDTTELLHVGTSAGRSDFQGLRRINNTTDPVTTAISAHDSLIIEQ